MRTMKCSRHFIFDIRGERFPRATNVKQPNAEAIAIEESETCTWIDVSSDILDQCAALRRPVSTSRIV